MMAAESELQASETGRLYSVCIYSRGAIVPQVQFLEAANDEAALTIASSMKPWMTREVWERHRLVRTLKPTL